MQAYGQVQNEVVEVNLLEDADVVFFSFFTYDADIDTDGCGFKSNAVDALQVVADFCRSVCVSDFCVGYFLNVVGEDGCIGNLRLLGSSTVAYLLAYVVVQRPAQLGFKAQILRLVNRDDINLDVARVGVAFGVEVVGAIDFLHGAIVQVKEVPELDLACATLGQGHSIEPGLHRQVEVLEVVVVVDTRCGDGGTTNECAEHPAESFSLHIIIVLSRGRKKCLLHEELRIIERKITT